MKTSELRAASETKAVVVAELMKLGYSANEASEAFDTYAEGVKGAFDTFEAGDADLFAEDIKSWYGDGKVRQAQRGRGW